MLSVNITVTILFLCFGCVFLLFGIFSRKSEDIALAVICVITAMAVALGVGA